MSPEEYQCHRERLLWLDEHPLVNREDIDFRGKDTRQATLEEVVR